MKILYTILFSLIFSSFLFSQNVGIGTNTPSAKLEVQGNLKIGNGNGSENGTIRYAGSNFEGRRNDNWEVLGVPQTGMILSHEYRNQYLLDNGFSFYKEFSIPTTQYTEIPYPSTFQANSWYEGYFKGDVDKLSAPFSPNSNYLLRDSTLLVYEGNGQFYFFKSSNNSWDFFELDLPSSYNSARGTLSESGNNLFFVTGDKDNPGYKINLSDSSIIELPDMPTSYNFKSQYATELIDNKIILYGGYDDGILSNTGVYYDIASNTWTNMNNANAPSPLVDIETCGLLKEFCVFGGRIATNVISNYSDYGKFYDVSINSWIDMTATGAFPKGRIGHTMTAVNSDFFVLFGGLINNSSSGHKDTSDVWIYQYSSGWSNSFDLPGEGRGDHTAVADANNNIIVYGGADQIYNSGSGGATFQLTDGFILDPFSAVKTPIAKCFFTSARRFDAQSFWTGNQLFVAGGSCFDYSGFGAYTAPSVSSQNCEKNQILIYNYLDLGEPKPNFFQTTHRTDEMYIYRKE